MKLIILASLFAGVATRELRGQGPAFTYQGRLTDDGLAATGIYDLQFAIYPTTSGGSTLAGPITLPATAVSNGLFTVLLDFGTSPFSDGGERWIELGLRSSGAGAGGFTMLSPRQKITATPYAMTAGNLTGSVPDARLSANVALLNTHARFNGDVIAVRDLKGLRLQAGTNHVLSGEFSAIAGGVQNRNEGYAATIGGGQLNSIQTYANWSAIGGGQGNTIQSNSFYAWIGGGGSHLIEGGLNAQYNTISGGYDHAIRRDTQYGTISGGVQNTIQDNGDYGTIAGGGANIIRSNASFASIGGGAENTIGVGALYTAIPGGRRNVANANYSIAAGFASIINTNSDYSAIGGGVSNSIAANSTFSIIGGGANNIIQANADYAMIGGGKNNIASGRNATVSGGQVNIASGGTSAVGGGILNDASGPTATIAGGGNNTASGAGAAVGGGTDNTASGGDSAVGGGVGNDASGSDATVAGGYANDASGQYATVAGGANNTASGKYATVPGGVFNVAQGAYSFAAGSRAKANHAGSFVWADSLNADFASFGYDQFLVRAAGGVHVIGTGDLSPAVGGFLICGPVSGANLAMDANEIMARNDGAASSLFLNASGGNVSIGTSSATHRLRVVSATCDGNSWNNASDRSQKERFEPVDARTVLAKVAALPIQRWNYTNAPSSRHLGPTAQEFHAAFGLNGDDDKHIATVDADGVALAAIQGLNQKLEEQRAENTDLKRRVSELERLVSKLSGQGE